MKSHVPKFTSKNAVVGEVRLRFVNYPNIVG